MGGSFQQVPPGICLYLHGVWAIVAGDDKKEKEAMIIERPLSDLQKTILTTAYRNTHRMVKRHEILIEHYGFTPTRDLSTLDSHQSRQGANMFNRINEGMNRYKQCQVAVTKSYVRLIARGLAEFIDFRELSLTPEGVEVAKGLLGNL